MNEEDPFPKYFYSKTPLPEKVNLIHLKNDQFYWMLNVENPLQPPIKSEGSFLAPYDDNETELLDCCDFEDNYEINPTKTGKYLTTFYVAPSLLSVIVGPKGSKLRELQDNTNTLIKVPRPNESPFVKITGQTERSVASARTQIALLTLSKREKMSITHFISIPMYSDEIQRNFAKFKNDILKGPSTRGIDETIFQRVEKFHLTIVTLTLLDKKEIEDAKNIINKIGESIKGLLSNKRITLKGVEIMNDDPNEVDVLYGKVAIGSQADNDTFQGMVDDISEVFYRNGLVKRQYDSVKLHVTLMNSLFRSGDDYQKDKNSSKRETFDATCILDQYRYYYFGKTTFDQIHMSIRFTSGKNGYYDAETILRL